MPPDRNGTGVSWAAGHDSSIGGGILLLLGMRFPMTVGHHFAPPPPPPPPPWLGPLGMPNFFR